MSYKVPEANELSEMLEMLFGTTPSVETLETMEQPSHSATYINPDDAAVATCHCDLGFAAHSACALSMIPAEEAEAAVSAGALSEMMLSNLYEVMNIFSNLLMSSSTPHLKLSEVNPVGSAQEVSTTRSATYRVEIAQYGGGVVSFCAS